VTTPIVLEELTSLRNAELPETTTELTLFRCDLSSLEELNRLPALETLRILCCQINEHLDLPSAPLNHVEVNFSTLTSAASLSSRPLTTLRLFGVPLDRESRVALSSAKARIVEQSPDEEWQHTRTLWERGARACFGGIPGVYPVIVRPGASVAGRRRFSEIWPYELTGDVPTDADALVERGYFKEGATLDSIDRFRCTWETGNSDDALRWLASASLSDEDRACIRAVIERFSTKRFYRSYPAGLDLVERAQKTKIPTKLRSFFTNVLQSIGTPSRSWRACLDGYDRDYLGRGSRAWHYIGAVGYMNSESKDLLEPASVYCVGERIFEQGSGEQSSLAISHHDNEDAIYEFRDMDLFDERRRGQLDPRRYAVFRSWPSLLSHVVEVEDR
jgi:hypothetical protein